jgi:hypothetical protein
MPAYWGVREGYPVSNCEEVWKIHGQWSAWFFGLGLGLLPFVMATFALAEWLRRFVQFPDWLAFLPVWMYFAALVILGYVKQQLRCPRCGARFYRWGPWGIFKGGIVRDCSNCGLKKWQCLEEVSAETEAGGIVIRPRHESSSN